MKPVRCKSSNNKDQPQPTIYIQQVGQVFILDTSGPPESTGHPAGHLLCYVLSFFVLSHRPDNIDFICYRLINSLANSHWLQFQQCRVFCILLIIKQFPLPFKHNGSNSAHTCQENGVALKTDQEKLFRSCPMLLCLACFLRFGEAGRHVLQPAPACLQCGRIHHWDVRLDFLGWGGMEAPIWAPIPPECLYDCLIDCSSCPIFLPGLLLA